MRISVATIGLVAALLGTAAPAAAEEPFTHQESVIAVRNIGFMLGLIGGPLKRCDPAYDTAVVRSAVEALVGRIDLWMAFDEARRLGASEVERRMAATPPSTIDCDHYRRGASTVLGVFLDKLPLPR